MVYYTGVNAQLLERPFLLLLPRDGDAHLLAPKLETGPFRDALPLVVHSWDDSGGPGRAFAELLSDLGTTGTWGCEGKVPFGFLHHLLARGLRVQPADQVLQSIREIKEPEELRLHKRSAAILCAAVLELPRVLREGMSERELARFIIEEALARGADEVAPLVQSGPRSADPHSQPSARKIRRAESVVVDVVSSYLGYSADITRTFALGRESAIEKTYESVLSAQVRAIRSARAGVTTGAVDAAARTSLERDGLGEYFIHRTGHGLGLEVHEAPYIVAGGRELLREGMVFTVEPGAYIPGRLGVRIEDDLVVAGGGRCEETTRKVPKEYGWWRR